MGAVDSKSILIFIAVWIICYGANCICVLPDGRHNEADYIALPKPLAFILFLPLAIGKCSSYLLICVLLLFTVGAAFIALMLLFREQMYVNIAVSAVFVFGIFLLLYLRSRKIRAAG